MLRSLVRTIFGCAVLLGLSHMPTGAQTIGERPIIVVPPLPGTGPRIPEGMGPRITIPRHLHDRLRELRPQRFLSIATGTCTVYDLPNFRGASTRFQSARQSLAFVLHRGSVPREWFRHVGQEWDNRITSYRCDESCLFMASRVHPPAEGPLITGTFSAQLPRSEDNAISSVYALCLHD